MYLKRCARLSSALRSVRQRSNCAVGSCIAPTKSNGRSWDALNAKPDPIVRLIVDGVLVATCHEEDTQSPSCEGAFVGKILNLKMLSQIEVHVTDSDSIEDDPIGNGSAQATSGTMVFQTNGQLTSASLVVQDIY